MLRPFAYLAGRQSSPSIRHPFLQPEQRQTLSLKSKEYTKQKLIPIKMIKKGQKTTGFLYLMIQWLF